VQHVPTLTEPAMFVSSAGAPRRDQRRRLIDAIHRGLTTAEAVHERLQEVGPIVGKATLRDLCDELLRLTVESIFQDDVAAVLEALGYGPGRSTLRIDTPDGRGVTFDVPLVDWCVSVEPCGDRFHRTREQRRLERRRAAAIAGTPWIQVPVDWRDWLLDRPAVLAAIDAAIAMQRARGIGADIEPPRRDHG
jgi:hypothetical protein